MDSNITPFIYKDLTGGGMDMMPYAGNPFLSGMYQTNLLGGVRFAEQSDHDKFVRMEERKQKEKSVFLKSMAALLIIGGSAALLFKGKLNISKFFKNAVPGTKNGVSKAGHAIVTPFKRFGSILKKGARKVGNGIAIPFKWLANKIKKK